MTSLVSDFPLLSQLLAPLVDFVIPVANAQQGGAPQLSGFQQILASPLFLIAVMVPMFYFLAIRPQMKRAKEAREMLGKLAKGDEAVTTGGLAGKITAIGENYVTLEIADKVEVKVQKGAITTVLPKGTLKNL
jgi:preprotein translocase subunit YajC